MDEHELVGYDREHAIKFLVAHGIDVQINGRIIMACVFSVHRDQPKLDMWVDTFRFGTDTWGVLLVLPSKRFIFDYELVRVCLCTGPRSVAS